MTTVARIQHVQSRDNAQLKALRRLAQHATSYRVLGHCWVEGEHLLQAAWVRGVRADPLVVAASRWPSVETRDWATRATRILLLPDALMAGLEQLESRSGIAAALPVPVSESIDWSASSVVLEQVQDAGNVGAILRSAAALGCRQVLAMHGTAALWSPKVLRAAMGAHWSLQLHENVTTEALEDLRVPLLATTPHEGPFLHEMLQKQELPTPAAWAFGHEGQGLSSELLALAGLRVRIAQPGGEESLNVSAAAAICLHASAAAMLESAPSRRGASK